MTDLRKKNGFTLIEALAIISISAVLLAITIPNMRGLIEQTLVSSAVNDFASAVNTSRTEAIKRGMTVVMCASSNASSPSPSCSSPGTAWESGWIIFTDRLKTNAFSTTDSILLQAQGALNRGGSISQDPASALVFEPTGLMSSGRSAFSFEANSKSDAQKRRLCLSSTGRIHLIAKSDEVCP